MKISELIQLIDAVPVSKGSEDRDITSGIVCDLLSWVMANGKTDMAWVTVQTNINVVAVATLHNLGCIILPEKVKMEDAPLNKALAEGIWVISSPKSAYEICGLLYEKGIR